jgi:type IV secretion system protein VirB8
MHTNLRLEGVNFMSLRSFFSKKRPTITRTGVAEDVVAKTRNWYHDRYASVLMQRNFLLLFNFVMIAIVLISVVAVQYISQKRTIEPFVVQIESDTGITSIIDPYSTDIISADKSLHTYFIVKYLRARETYDTSTYDYNYTTVARVLSSSRVYAGFRAYLNNKTLSPITRYGAATSTTVQIRSVQILKAGSLAQVRFRIVEEGQGRRTYDKIATISYTFVPMQLDAEERYINPLGFQVTSYQVDDEVL